MSVTSCVAGDANIWLETKAATFPSKVLKRFRLCESLVFTRLHRLNVQQLLYYIIFYIIHNFNQILPRFIIDVKILEKVYLIHKYNNIKDFLHVVGPVRQITAVDFK